MRRGAEGTGAKRVLVIEDDAALREVMTFNLEEAGWQVEARGESEQAVRDYDAARHDVVLTDLRMRGLDGMQVLEVLRERDEDVVVVMITAHGSADRALEAMQRGAFHYVEKPVNTRSLLALMEKARELRVLRRAQRRNTSPTPASTSSPKSEALLISASPAMNEVLRVVDRVARSEVPVVIQGESGTGKELIARAIHARSARREGPFVAVNCAAIPEDLLESILFGHRRGAFTGATQDSKGKFSLADGGTLFLDEIGEMSAQLQSKLLRVLQDGEVDVIGGRAPERVDVRVLSATHQNLEESMARGAFRQDLYYRLAVIPLELPALRERREDIPVLARHLLRRHGGEGLRVSEAVDRALMAHRWPGNVRELENLVKRLIVLSDGEEVRLEDLPDGLRGGGEEVDAPQELSHGSAGVTLPFTLPEQGLDLMALERAVLEAALQKFEGNQSATARYLNIPRHVLLYRMEKYARRDEASREAEEQQ